MLEKLFQPCAIGKLGLSSRFVMSPMQDRRPLDLLPSVDLAAHYVDRIKGGIGLIVTQGTTMDHPTSQSPYARLFPPAYEGWRRCAAAVREHGGQIAMQLWHEGAQRQGGYGPSGLSYSGQKTGQELTRDQLAALIETYAASAAKVKELGFSAVELHGGHAYLLGQFLSSAANRRDDEWGGETLEQRMAFPLAVTRAVRQAVGPDFPISFRISQLSAAGAPKTFRNPDELGALVRALQAAGVDMFDVLTMRYWQEDYDGADFSLAGWIKRACGAPVISGGSVGLSNDLLSTLSGATAYSTAHEGFAELERRFERGDFDLIALGRTILLDPDFLVKLRSGAFDALKQSYVAAEISSEARSARNR